MSLNDRTNETIVLSLEPPSRTPLVGRSEEHPATIGADVDYDSSLTPADRVVIDIEAGNEDMGVALTYEEAGLLHDRLGLILQRPKFEGTP